MRNISHWWEPIHGYTPSHSREEDFEWLYEFLKYKIKEVHHLQQKIVDLKKDTPNPKDSKACKEVKIESNVLEKEWGDVLDELGESESSAVGEGQVDDEDYPLEMWICWECTVGPCTLKEPECYNVVCRWLKYIRPAQPETQGPTAKRLDLTEKEKKSTKPKEEEG